MRRRLTHIATCILLGSVTTIAVAWSCAWWRPWPRPWEPRIAMDASGQGWIGFGEDGIGWATRTLYGAPGITATGRTIAATLPSWIDTPRENALDERAYEVVSAGWPFKCFTASRTGIGHQDPPPGGAWHTGMGPQWVEWGAWRGAISAAPGIGTGPSVSSPTPIPGSPPPAADSGQVLPISVLPTRFAATVIFWAAVWSLPLVFLALRAARRRRNGRCPRCGYNLRGDMSRGCPECGWGRTPVQ